MIITGISSPHASFAAANSMRHHPRERHDAKLQTPSATELCAVGGTSTHICALRST